MTAERWPLLPNGRSRRDARLGAGARAALRGRSLPARRLATLAASARLRRRIAPPTPIAVDGRLDDAGVDASAPWSDPFVDIEGDAKPRPHLADAREDALGRRVLLHRRRARGAARLGDAHESTTRSSFTTTTSRSSSIPNGDNHEYYEFEINALSTYWDLLLAEAVSRRRQGRRTAGRFPD